VGRDGRGGTPPAAGETPTPLLREKGVYLITGGWGGIGLALAEHLARKVRARLVLVGRSPLPPREEWESRKQKAESRKQGGAGVGEVLTRLLEIERLGGELLVAQADVADRDALARVARLANERFGAIHGIIHSAGVAGGGIIPLQTVAMARAALQPKVQGLEALVATFASGPLDFVFLCSSLSSVLGGFGQIHYCAANAYLDAFAHDNPFRQRGVCTRSINWDTWAEVGMAVNTVVPDDLKPWKAEGLRRGIRVLEGQEIFDRILGSDQPQVLVSTIDLTARLRQAQGREPSAPPPMPRAAPTAAPQSSHPRPNVSAAYLAPRNPTEETIASIWAELLGLQSVGIHDDFLELGGHSLLAIQLISRLRDAFQVELSIQGLFESPTVAGLASLIESGMASGTAAPAEAVPPPLVRVSREQYRAKVSTTGVADLPPALRRKPSNPP